MKKPLESFDSRGFWSEWRGSNPRPDGPKPPALSTAPHPDKYVRFYYFCVEVGQTVVKRKFHAVLRFY